MKTHQLAALAAAVIAVNALGATRTLAATTSATPTAPTGSLTAYPTVVQTGTKPTLTWNIIYPAVAKDYITINPTLGTITPNQNLLCDIRILGAGVTTQNPNGSINYIETKCLIKYNGLSSWTTIFDGKETDSIVQKQGIIKTLPVTAAKAIDFGGQYNYNGWSTLRSSTTNPTYVWTLVNGDTPPNKIPGYNAPSLSAFVKPYLDTSGKVKIGPMDVIVFMELTDTNPANVGYDQQDLVLLVTFRTS